MILSDVSVRRPVFAMVLSLLLTIIGLMAAGRLSIRETPNVQPPVVSIETVYRGASASVIETKITQVIENQIAGLEGVDTLRSTSQDERSRITIEFSLDRDIESAANDVRDRVSRVLNNLPQEADPPEVAKVDTTSEPIMWLNLESDRRSQLELTDYAQRYLVDRFSVVKGVAQVRISGERRFAMRVWLDRQALAARRLTVQDVEDALRAENVELPAGRIESSQREFTLHTDTGLYTPSDFRQLVVGRGEGGYMVRLGEVADVELAAEDLRNVARSDGQPALSLGIVPQSTANVLEVATGVKAEMALVAESLPDDIKMGINVDDTVFVSGSINEVIHALVIALILVLIVIYLFLGTVRATLIPAVTIPVSIISASIVMVIAGFSINVLTLLGAVLAIGLVVDDAIVVLENIVRRIELGQPPLLAAVDGSREIGFAVIATTLVLIAVFLPISFIPGNIGRLFGEFGITIAAAIAFSALVSLTLVPMMSSKIFGHGIVRGRVAHAVDRFFKWLSGTYERSLRKSLHAPALILGAGAAAIALAVVLFRLLPAEYAPSEDRQRVVIILTAPEGSSLQYMERFLKQVEQIAMVEVEKGNARRMLSRLGNFGGGGEVSVGRVVLSLSDFDERKESAQQIAARIRPMVSNLAGVRATVVTPGGLGIRGFGPPVQIVLGGGDYAELARWRDIILQKAAENPGLTNLDSDYYARKPQMKVSVDRNRAADLGVSLTTVGRTLETMMGSRIVTTFLDRGEEYNVMLQARENDRATPSNLTNLYVRSSTTGSLVPAVEPGAHRGGRRSDGAAALRPAALDHSLGRPQSRLFAGRSARLHGKPGAQRAAGARADQLRRRVARVQALRLGAVRDLRAGAGHRVPGAGGAVRELPPSIHHHDDRAARRDRRAARLVGHVRLDQRVQPDRLHHADRPGGQERHPDRRVRQPAARPRHRVPRSRDRSGRDPPAPGADDQPVYGVRRDPVVDRLGRGRREPQVDRRSGRLRRDVLAAADAVRRAGRVRLCRT